MSQKCHELTSLRQKIPQTVPDSLEDFINSGRVDYFLVETILTAPVDRLGKAVIGSRQEYLLVLEIERLAILGRPGEPDLLYDAIKVTEVLVLGVVDGANSTSRLQEQAVGCLPGVAAFAIKLGVRHTNEAIRDLVVRRIDHENQRNI